MTQIKKKIGKPILEKNLSKTFFKSVLTIAREMPKKQREFDVLLISLVL